MMTLAQWNAEKKKEKEFWEKLHAEGDVKKLQAYQRLYDRQYNDARMKSNHNWTPIGSDGYNPYAQQACAQKQHDLKELYEKGIFKE